MFVKTWRWYLICRASIIVVSNFDFPESKILKLLQEKFCLHVLHTFKWSDIADEELKYKWNILSQIKNEFVSFTSCIGINWKLCLKSTCSYCVSFHDILFCLIILMKHFITLCSVLAVWCPQLITLSSLNGSSSSWRMRRFTWTSLSICVPAQLPASKESRREPDKRRRVCL